MKNIRNVIVLLAIAITTNANAQNALNFDGTDDYIQTPYSGVLGSNDRTFEAYVFVPSSAPASNLTITDYGVNLSGSRNTFLVAGDRALKFVSGGTNGNITSLASAVPEDQWVHVAFVLNSGTGYLYVNGIEVGTGNLTGVNTPSGNEDMTIGQRVLGGSILFNGNIDEVRIWDVARTQVEIVANMNTELCLVPTSLVAYYKLNEGIAGGANAGETTSTDLSAAGNNGTLQTFALTGATSNWVAGSGITVPTAATSTQVYVENPGFTVTVNGNTYSTTGIYVDVLVGAAANGCDSIVTTDLTITAAPTIALNFDYVDDYITTNYSGISGNASRTVEAWVKAPMTAGQIVIVDWGTVGTGARFTFAMNNGLLRVEVLGNGASSSTVVGDDMWHHVAVVYDNAAATKFTTYIDGVLEANFNLTVPVNTGTSVDMLIGNRIDLAKPFNGSIDEVRVWDVPRTQAEIVANMNSEFCSVPAELVAYHKLNEGVAAGANAGVTNSPDLAVGMNNGTLQNFALTGATSNWVTGSGITAANAATSMQTYTECPGFTTTVNGNTYNTTGIYSDVLVGAASNGCDSIVTTDLTIISGGVFNQTLVECAGYSITINGNTYNSTGIYTDVLSGAAASGCDSIVTTDLTIQTAITSNLTWVECAGFSVTINGNVYDATGVYSELIVGGSMAGCDSTVNLDLTVLAEASSTVTLVNCPGQAVVIGGSVYANAGVYSVVLAGASVTGCDSTVNLDLSFFAPVTNAVTMTECFGFSTVIDGTTYDANGTYTLFYNNASVNGCDSTVTLDLTIAPAIDVTTTATDTSITAVNTIGTYQWIDCGNGNIEIPTETNQTYEATANGSYAVVVTEGNCSDTSACVSISVIGLEENAIANSINVYPNPTNGKVNVELSQVQNATIIVTDNMGREVYKMNASESIVTIDLAGFDKGMYFFNIQSSEVNTVTSVVLH